MSGAECSVHKGDLPQRVPTAEELNLDHVWGSQNIQRTRRHHHGGFQRHTVPDLRQHSHPLKCCTQCLAKAHPVLAQVRGSTSHAAAKQVQSHPREVLKLLQ